MATWLYQMSGNEWAPERYREEIWEGDETSWPQGNVRGGHPESGDSLILWYARSVSDDPGLYGWGVILGAREEVIRWRPVSPSDYLKMDPLFDQELSDLVDAIRGRVRQGTMWTLDAVKVGQIRMRVRESLRPAAGAGITNA